MSNDVSNHLEGYDDEMFYYRHLRQCYIAFLHRPLVALVKAAILTVSYQLLGHIFLFTFTAAVRSIIRITQSTKGLTLFLNHLSRQSTADRCCCLSNQLSRMIRNTVASMSFSFVLVAALLAVTVSSATKTGTDLITEILRAAEGRSEMLNVAIYLNMSRDALVKELPLETSGKSILYY